jgi:hypothetical protein
MPQRRFLVASSLARLIRKEGGMAGHLVEGYFPARRDREHFVSIEPGHCFLVLAPTAEGAGPEERTEVPRSQAEALLTVCAHKIGFQCTIVRLRNGRQALLQRFVAPASLDLLSVEFAEDEDADGFAPPIWFGPEVTENPAYDRGSLARVGMPAPQEIPLSNVMLDELLDVLEEGRFAAELGRGAALKVQDNRPASRPSEGPPPSEPQPAPIEGADNGALIAGLAEALKEFEPSQPAPDADAATEVDATPAQPARPRLSRAGWR